jgi:hypothetical protein
MCGRAVCEMDRGKITDGPIGSGRGEVRVRSSPYVPLLGVAYVRGFGAWLDWE